MKAILLLLFISLNAQAFPTTLHYTVTTEPEELALESAASWDSEAASDFVTYQMPLEWEAQWWHSPKSFDMTLGSISSKQFLSYKRIKIHQKLNDSVEFRLHFLEARDFEQDRVSLPIELKFRMSPQWAISIFGMPSFYKSEDDVGASLFWTPLQHWEFRLSGLKGDFQRNQRNTGTDRWAKAPTSQTLSALYLPEDKTRFLNMELHHETPSTRTDATTASQTDLVYDAFLLTGNYGRILYDRAFRSSKGQVFVRQRFLHQVEHAWVAGNYRVRPGLNLFYHQTRIAHRQIIDREILPTFWLEGPGIWSVGLDSTIYERQEGNRQSGSWQNRLNVKLNKKFAESGELALLFTADLDQLGSGQTWEGGAGQFRIDF